MRILPVVFLAGLLVLAPMASASVTRTGVIGAFTPVLVAGPLEIFSNPVFQNANTLNVQLQPGDTITATLTWTDTSATPTGNDLDLALGPPSTPPTSLLPEPPFPPGAQYLTWLSETTSATLVRVSCDNFVAQSHAHFPDPAGFETLTYTVPAGGESGAYRLTITGFLVLADQPYTISVTVLRGGADVTNSVLGPTQLTPFVRTSAHCQVADPL